MGRGKKYQAEQVVNLRQQIEVAIEKRRGYGAGVERSRES
jgi:hypothetical protein